MYTSIVICRQEKIITQYLFLHTNSLGLIFFLFLKGIRLSVWKTPGIEIGGKNPTDVNFAIIRNQVRLLILSSIFNKV